MTDETMSSGEHEEHVHPPYMKVFSILAALTLIELFIPPTIGDVTWLSVSLLILIAAWKMKLIMGYFMHLLHLLLLLHTMLIIWLEYYIWPN